MAMAVSRDFIDNKCIGFGEYLCKCENQVEDNPYWCPRCDMLRKQMQEIAKKAGINYEQIL